ncbi:MAG: chorismate synthase [Gracilibacteraceae bacterium]|jgi:chorismate synthase|nr:chorismate synthase [Gracilibacteraceae bacterium]
MSSSWKNRLSLFGESHGPGIGVVLNGLPPGFFVDWAEVSSEMRRRAPDRSKLSTERVETDSVEILSGLFQGRTTGSPLCALIRNLDTRSDDYAEIRDKPRPGHSDYPAFVRGGGFNDYRGGGHFSGRLTAPLVFAGALVRQILRERGVSIGAHIQRIRGVTDNSFATADLSPQLFAALSAEFLPVLNKAIRPALERVILEARAAGDSVGGVVECAILGLAPGLGAPFFDSVESALASLFFAVPAVKGVSFGLGFALAERLGSESNDAYYFDENGRVRTRTNNCGGLLGGLTTGMPLVCSVAVKPTASIARPQETVDLRQGTAAVLAVRGRHDPCIVPRVVPVLESVAALAIWDLMEGGGG